MDSIKQENVSPLPSTPPPSPEKKERKSNAWLVHLKAFHAEHPELSWKQVMQQGKASYTK
jgi:hypothetical protein